MQIRDNQTTHNRSNPNCLRNRRSDADAFRPIGFEQNLCRAEPTRGDRCPQQCDRPGGEVDPVQRVMSKLTAVVWPPPQGLAWSLKMGDTCNGESSLRRR